MTAVTAVDIVLLARLIMDIVAQFEKAGVKINLDELPALIRDERRQAEANNAVMGIK